MTFPLPNILSIIRILVSPFFLLGLISENPVYIQYACLLYLIGAITDFFDGWLARKYHIESQWGKFLDPLADKFLTSSAFLAFVFLGIVPMWMFVIIVFRDFFTTVLRIFAENLNMSIATSLSAKLKTLLQMIFIFFIIGVLFLKSNSSFDLSEETTNFLLFSDWVYYSMLVLTLLTLWTAIEYIYFNKKLFAKLFSKSAS